MFRKMTYLVSFALVFSLVGDVQSATVTWTDADSADSFWSTPGNWGSSTVPTSTDTASIGLLRMKA